MARRPAEVALLDLGARREAVGGTFERDLADLEHVRTLGDGQRHRGVLLDEDDRGPLTVDLADDLGDPRHDLRRQAERRLVEQQQLGLAHQRPADRQHLLLAAGQQDGALTPALVEAREQVDDALVGSPAGGAVTNADRAGAEVLLDGQLAEDAAPLGNLHDPCAHDLRG